MFGSSDSQIGTIFGKNTACYSLADTDHIIKDKIIELN